MACGGIYGTTWSYNITNQRWTAVFSDSPPRVSIYCMLQCFSCGVQGRIKFELNVEVCGILHSAPNIVHLADVMVKNVTEVFSLRRSLITTCNSPLKYSTLVRELPPPLFKVWMFITASLMKATGFEVWRRWIIKIMIIGLPLLVVILFD